MLDYSCIWWTVYCHLVVWLTFVYLLFAKCSNLQRIHRKKKLFLTKRCAAVDVASGGSLGLVTSCMQPNENKGKKYKKQNMSVSQWGFSICPPGLTFSLHFIFCTIAFCLPQQIFKEKYKVICKVYGLMATPCYCSGRNIKLDEHTFTDLLEPLLMFFEFLLFFVWHDAKFYW